jgi:hypothetical protein
VTVVRWPQPPRRAPETPEDAETWYRDVTRWMGLITAKLEGSVIEGDGSPEGAVPARIGTVFVRRDGGAGTSCYIKEADDGAATGWAAV